MNTEKFDDLMRADLSHHPRTSNNSLVLTWFIVLLKENIFLLCLFSFLIFMHFIKGHNYTKDWRTLKINVFIVHRPQGETLQTYCFIFLIACLIWRHAQDMPPSIGIIFIWSSLKDEEVKSFFVNDANQDEKKRLDQWFSVISAENV